MNKYEVQLNKLRSVILYIGLVMAIIGNALDLIFAKSDNITLIISNYSAIGLLSLCYIFHSLKLVSTKRGFEFIILILMLNVYLGLVLFTGGSYGIAPSELLLRESIIILLLISITSFFVSRYLSYFILVSYLLIYSWFSFTHNNQYLISNTFLLFMIFIMFTLVFAYFNRLIHNMMNTLRENNIAISEHIEEIKSQNENLHLKQVSINIKNHELEDQKDQLLELNNTKDRLFSIISHDLKNPFSSLLGFSELLKSNYEKYDDEKRLRFIKNINDSAHSTYNLLENLLLWSRAQRKDIRFNPQEINLKDLIEENIALYFLPSEKKSITFLLEIKDSAFIYADKDMIDTVLRNLISNAVKFSYPGSEITIKASRTDNGMFISVADKGVGIEKANVSKLFSAGDHYTRNGTNNEVGSGLGLIICKEFIDMHGGNIRVESEADHGSTFTIELPVKSEAQCLCSI